MFRPTVRWQWREEVGALNPEGEENMFALAIVRYRRPLEEVTKAVEEHRAYLRELKKQGNTDRRRADGPVDGRRFAVARSR